MQRAVAAAQGVENEDGNVRVKFLTVFGHAKIAPVHGARRCSQAGAAGVFKGFARLEQWLVSNHTQALYALGVALGVVDAPGA